MKNSIVLFKAPDCWIAEYFGPHSEEIVDLFGTGELPLPWTEKASGEDVLADVQRRHLGVEVYLCDR